LRSAHQWEESGFTVVCEAQPPALPTSSTHRKIAVAIAALGSLLGLGLVLSLELADSTVKSPADVGLRLSCPVLGELPLIEAPDGATFPRPAPAHAEAVRVVTERVRRSLPEPGACVLVTSAAPGEGKTTVAASMAWCLGQRGERVLLIDGHLRPADPGDGVCRVVSRTTQSLAGLSDYLVGSASPAETLVQPTDVAGVDWLPRGRCDVSPDLLASQRLRELLTQFSLQYTILILDTGPVLSAIDTETLAGLADGAVLVVRSRLCRAAVLQEARARLEATGVTVLGTVLNAVEPEYSRLPRTRASSNGTGGSPA
jgi:capsular exopolysaccharide synthesis family protein